MKRSYIKQLLEEDKVDLDVMIQGWVRTKRDQKSFSFIAVNDGSCFDNIQVVADSKIPEYATNITKITTGAAVEIKGKLVKSQGKEQGSEIHATQMTVIGECSTDYPLQKKRHSNEFLRTVAHIRPRTNTFGAVFRLRSTLSFAIHKFFQEKGFVHLHSPILTASDCEGAGELFRVSSLDLENPPKSKDGDIDFSQDFFGKPSYLTVSGQLQAELFANAFDRVYTFGPTFRAENSNTTRHLAEFWMIEPEMAFCDLKGNMDIAEDFIRYIVGYVLDNCAQDMNFFNKWIEKGIVESLEALRKEDFERITYTEAIEGLKKAKQKFEFPVEWGCNLQTEHERYLTEKYVKKPVFVTDYPKEIKAFYMRLNEDGKTVSAMDLLVPRLGEIIGGSQREEREDHLRQRLKENEIDEQEMNWYMDIRRYGTTPHSGFGLGFERMVMYLTGMSNIRDVIPFPRTPGNIHF